jgi:predicted type IV restriction endonuclease
VSDPDGGRLFLSWAGISKESSPLTGGENQLVSSYAEVKIEVEHLVERFARNLDVYKRPDYKEARARVEFIDPFFEALGWDVRNVQGYAEQYKDVVHEDTLKVSGAARAPDYCFRIGGTRKFFLEAKKPSVSVKGDVGPAYQLRRYAWSAKLPLSILTDFEEFATYDCRQRPKPNDKASVGRVMYLTFEQYPDRFDDIYGVFAKESVLQGSFDRYVQDTKRKRGTSEVDTEFLKEIEGWRDVLARNIALRNPALSVHELNFAVQRTIDRIIFLRMCEDRDIEGYGRLLALTSGPHIYARLADLYRQADEKYDAGLFDFQADTLTKTLAVDDKVLKPILAGLYYPQSPYEFSVLPAEVLGQVYEQFLGKVIRLTPSHRAVVEEKPEVKKAGGVYYTPAYIVDYIVRQTVGRLVEDKTPRQIAKLRILDPACGSGSFLLGAYQYLLDYHRQWYKAHDPAKHARGKQPAVYQGPKGEWRLTTAEKKRILLNNIFGVDIDRQAVGVTKLSLLLKVLEGENQETLGQQLSLWRERALPDLGNNIKCGNSLIGPDYFETQLLPDEEEIRRVNPFDWQAEFLEVMAAGGFDAVIGNPPYIFTREQFAETERQYFSAKYKASWEKHNTFMLFMELMLRLLNNGGKGGFIVPNSWLTIESAHLLRGLFIPYLELVADLNYRVFEHVSMEPCIFAISGSKQKVPVLALRAQSKDSFMEQTPFQVERERWSSPGHRVVFSHAADSVGVVDKIVSTSGRIGATFDVRSGLQAYERGKGKPPQTADDVKSHAFDRNEWEDENSIKYLQGRDVDRYELDWSGQWLQYGHWLAQPRKLEIFTRPRVLLREITSDFPYCLKAVHVAEPYLNNKSVLNVLHPDDSVEELKCLLGILNSQLMSLFYKQRAVKSARRIFPKVVIRNLREFPYPNTDAVVKRTKLIRLVDRMLALHQKLAATTISADKTLYQRQIVATDRQIDALVYELYGLTEEEIQIVEEATG